MGLVPLEGSGAFRAGIKKYILYAKNTTIFRCLKPDKN